MLPPTDSSAGWDACSQRASAAEREHLQAVGKSVFPVFAIIVEGDVRKGKELNLNLV